MKVKFKYGIQTYSGTIDEMVYGSYNDDKLCIGREYVYPRLTEQNAAIGSVAGNLSAIWAEASEGWKSDLKLYAQRNASENVPKSMLAPRAYALYIKLMYAWEESDPDHVDLETVTAADVDTLGTKIQTIKACVENEMLPAVSQIDDLIETF